MSSSKSPHMHHGHHHKPQHAHAAHYLSEGKDSWVGGIAALREGDSACELLVHEEAATLTGKMGSVKGNGAGAAEGAAAATAEPAAAAVAVAGAAPGGAPADFATALEHALAVAVKEAVDMGEVVLEAGSPTGWGPTNMTKDQLAECLARLKAAAEAAGCDAVVLRERTGGATVPAGGNGPAGEAHLADVVVRRRGASAVASAARDGPLGRPPIEVRVAVIGNVDSGKSTMVGVLTRSILDDGRGLARSKVFKHGHEEATGRTSSIGQHTLCIDSTGQILNDSLFRNQTCSDYIARASKVVTLVDLAGHEKYFRTTAYGLTGHMPDYACLMVGANMGVVGMCKEHLGVALALKVPAFFVITKVDICPEHILKQTVTSLTQILRKPGVKKKPFLVRSVDDVLLCARMMNVDSLAPIFLTSSVTGKGLDLVRLFYNLLPQRQRWVERQAEMAEFVIDETFGVPGVGTVVAGTVKRGVITTHSTLLLGPDAADGLFKPVAIKSIHYKRLPVSQVVAGQTAALALKKVKRNQVRKGMALVDERMKPKASWEFDADIAILTHSTTIQPRYQAVIHCEIIRQAAKVVAMDVERLRSGDRACVRFRFIQRPEYITANTRFVFREGRTKGIGIVVGTEHDSPLPRTAAAPALAAGAGGDAAGTSATDRAQEEPQAGG